MTLEAFEARNPVERVFSDARAGSAAIEDALSAFAGASVFVSSRAEVMADGSGFEPLLLEHQGAPLVAVFTNADRAFTRRDRSEYLLQMRGRDLIGRTPAGYGLIINPGYHAQLIIEPAALVRLREAH